MNGAPRVPHRAAARKAGAPWTRGLASASLRRPLFADVSDLTAHALIDLARSKRFEELERAWERSATAPEPVRAYCGAIEALCDYFQRLGHKHIAFLGPDMPGDTILQKKLSAYACHTSRQNLPNICGLVSADNASVDQLAASWCDA